MTKKKTRKIQLVVIDEFQYDEPSFEKRKILEQWLEEQLTEPMRSRSANQVRRLSPS
jgi:hypothetical protein